MATYPAHVDIHPKRPYHPPKPEFRRATAVTIAAGFRCSDGVVLCADTEMSMLGWIKYPGSKVRFYKDLPFQPAFAFAGDGEFFEMVLGKLTDCINRSNGAKVLKAIESETWAIHQKFKEEDYEKQTDLLLSLRLNDRRNLFRLSRGFLSPVHSRSVCLGIGQGIAQGLITELFLEAGLSIYQTAIVAVYIVAEAKAYAANCGKDSHILILGDDGHWCAFPECPKHPSLSTREIEEEYLHFKWLIRPVLRQFCDYRLGEGSFGALAEGTKNSLIERRKNKRELFLRRLAEAEGQKD